jgi:hypothetical protein
MGALLPRIRPLWPLPSFREPRHLTFAQRTGRAGAGNTKGGPSDRDGAGGLKGRGWTVNYVAGEKVPRSGGAQKLLSCVPSVTHQGA